MGSNSHMAAVAMFSGVEERLQIAACSLSVNVIRKVTSGEVDGAVLPIENSLHGSVAEHYDLLLTEPVLVIRESSMRIRHNIMALPGVRLADVRSIISHPVALSQCRRWQGAHPEIQAIPFYDTAGGMKHIAEQDIRDTAAIAPVLAAKVYGAEVLVEGIEDHAENYTRFYLVIHREKATVAVGSVDKMSLAFSVEHRPGTLVEVLAALARVGADLTKIESRPVPGRPWEYVFYVDLRFADESVADDALRALHHRCGMVKELGRYRSVGDLRKG